MLTVIVGGTTPSVQVSGWLGVIGVILGVVGAAAFLLAYGDRLRLKNTIDSYASTVSAYEAQIVSLKAQNTSLQSQVGQCQGAIKVLTETVTQSAKVEMLAHTSEGQHRAIILKLDGLVHELDRMNEKVSGSPQ